MKFESEKVRLVGLVSDPKKDETSWNYVFHLKLSGLTDPIWDGCFREACDANKANPIPANVSLGEIVVRCGVADFEDHYFARIKEAIECANSEVERYLAEKKSEVAARAQQIKKDRERLDGLRDRLKFE